MPTTKPRMNLVLTEELDKRIEEYWHNQRIPNKTQAMLKIIERGLKAMEEEAPHSKAGKTED